jgi:hypothetical protein
MIEMQLSALQVRAIRLFFRQPGTWVAENGWREKTGGQLDHGVASMCDYSLHHVASRAARVGDKLTSASFLNSGTRGFAAVDEPNVAVCLLPGTEVAFDANIQCEGIYGFGFKRLPHKVARFRQVDLHQSNVHHDALELPNGQIIKLTTLRPGQHATVLQMPVSLQETRQDAELEEAAAM